MSSSHVLVEYKTTFEHGGDSLFTGALVEMITINEHSRHVIDPRDIPAAEVLVENITVNDRSRHVIDPRDIPVITEALVENQEADMSVASETFRSPRSWFNTLQPWNMDDICVTLETFQPHRSLSNLPQTPNIGDLVGQRVDGRD